MEPKPLSSERRTELLDELERGWRPVGDADLGAALAAEAYWRETVRNLPLRVRQSRPRLYEGYLQCPVCHSGFDRKEDTFNPDVHDDGCSWLLAHSEKETLAPPTV
jgi:hypothetical protein